MSLPVPLNPSDVSNPNPYFRTNSFARPQEFKSNNRKIWLNFASLQVLLQDNETELAALVTDAPNWTSPSAVSAPTSRAVGVRQNYLSKLFSGLYVNTWTVRAGDASLLLENVAWSPSLGLFVIVSGTATANNILTSPDGITWTPRAGSASLSLRGVAWSPSLSLFVTVALNATANNILTSPDGITWTARAGSASLQLHGVAWSPELGVFVVTGYNMVTNNILTSLDGITWTPRAGDSSLRSPRVAWSPELGVFVAPGYATVANNILTTQPLGKGYNI